jgi:hypothetical protein
MGLKRNIGGIVRKKETTRRPRSRWVDNTEIYLRETRWGDIYWIGVGEVRDRDLALVNTVMNIRVL